MRRSIADRVSARFPPQARGQADRAARVHSEDQLRAATRDRNDLRREVTKLKVGFICILRPAPCPISLGHGDTALPRGAHRHPGFVQSMTWPCLQEHVNPCWSFVPCGWSMFFRRSSCALQCRNPPAGKYCDCEPAGEECR